MGLELNIWDEVWLCPWLCPMLVTWLWTDPFCSWFLPGSSSLKCLREETIPKILFQRVALLQSCCSWKQKVQGNAF